MPTSPGWQGGGGTTTTGFDSGGNPLGNGDTVRRLKILNRYVQGGHISPADGLAFASDPAVSDDDLFRHVGRAVGFTHAVREAQKFRDITKQDALTGHGVTLQNEWDQLDPFRQGFLRDMGVVPPAERWHRVRKQQIDAKARDDGGFEWGDLISTPLDALDKVTAPIQSMGADALKGMDDMGHAITHGYRALSYLSAENNGGGHREAQPLNDAIGWVQNLDDFGNAWEQTGAANGEKSYLPYDKRRARDKAGSHANYMIAEELAMPDGGTIDEQANTWAAKQVGIPVGSELAKAHPQYQTAYSKFMAAASDPRTVSAAEYLRQQKMSIGRDTARGLGLDPGDGRPGSFMAPSSWSAYGFVSGMTDMAYSIFVDPTLLVGAGIKSVKYSRNAIEGVGYAERIMRSIKPEVNLRAAARATTDVTDANYLSELRKADLTKFERIPVMIHDVVSHPDQPAAWAKFSEYMGPNGQRMLPVVRAADIAMRVGRERAAGLGLGQSVLELERQAHPLDIGQFLHLAGNETQEEATRLAMEAGTKALTGLPKGQSWSDPEAVVNWFRDAPEAMNSVMDGRWAQHLHSYTALPQLSKMGATRLSAKLSVERGVWKWSDLGRRVDAAFAHLDELPIENYTPLTRLQRIQATGYDKGVDALHGVEKVGAHFVGGMGDAVRAMMNQLPKNSRAISIHGQEAVSEVDRWLRVGKLSHAEYEAQLGAILTATSVPARRAAMTSAMDKVFDSLGVSRSAGSWGDQWLTRMKGDLTNTFSPDPDIGSLLLGKRQTASPVYASQVADDYFPIPDFRELMHNVDRVNAFRALRDGDGKLALNGADSITDTFMQRLWKPGMVLRLGFIPRAMIDETIPRLARAGASVSIKQGFVYPTFMESADHPVAFYLRPFAAMERRLRNTDYAADFANNWRNTLEGAAEGLESSALPKFSTAGQRALDETKQALYKANMPNLDELKTLGGKIKLDDAGNLIVDRHLRRLVGYRDGDARMVRNIQSAIRTGVGRVWNTDDVRRLKELSDHPAIMNPYLDEVAGPNHMFADTGPVRQPGIGGYIVEKDRKGRTVVVPLRKQAHGEKTIAVTRANLSDVATRNAIEHVYGSVAYDLGARAAAGSVYVSPAQAGRLHQDLGLGHDGGMWSDDPYGFIEEARKDFTALSPEQRRAFYRHWRAVPGEAKDAERAHLASLLNPAGPGGEYAFKDNTALGYALNRWHTLRPNDQAVLMHRLDQHMDAVGGMGGVVGTEWDKAGVLTRDEFRAKYLDLHAAVEHGPTEAGLTKDLHGARRDLRKLQATPEYQAAAARSSGDDLMDTVYDEMIKTKNPFVADPTRVAPVWTAEQRTARQDLVHRAAYSEAADRQLREERVLEAIRDPRYRGQWAKAHGSGQTRGGIPLMKPVPEGYNRYYGILMPEGDARLVAEALESHPGGGQDELGGILDGFKTARGVFGGPVSTVPRVMGDMGSQYNLLSSWVSNDPEQMRKMVRLLQERSGVKLERFTIGEIDLHARRLTDPLHKAMGRYPNVPAGMIPIPGQYLAASSGWRFGDDIEALRDATKNHVLGAPAAVGATREEVDLDTARNMLADAETRFRGQGGEWNHVVAQAMHNGHYHPHDPATLPLELLPKNVYGPELYKPTRNIVDDMVRFGFDRVIAPPIRAIVRQPMFMDRAIEAHKLIDKEFRRRFVGAEHVVNGNEHAVKVLGEGFTGDDLYGQIDGLMSAIHERRDLTGTMGEELDGLLADIAEGKKLPLNNELLDWAHDRGLLKGELSGLEKIRSGKPVQTRMINDWYAKEADTRRLVVEHASSRAMNDVIPFIDDHRIRSQAAEHLRNIMPFYFAQELFLKRMVRTMAYDPAFIRKIQLGVHAGVASGFFHKDEYGADVITYPGTAFTQKMVNGISSLFGSDASIPFQVPMTGQVKYSSPGYGDIGLPSVGPAISVPLTYLANRYPELQPVETTLEGQRGTGHSVIEQLFPISALRFANALTDNADSSKVFAGLQFKVMQHMEYNATGVDREINKVQGQLFDAHNPKTTARLTEQLANLKKERNGLGVPGEDATPAEIDTWMERTENWTRNLLLTQAIVGFAAPASPQPEFPEIQARNFRALLKSLPVDEAVSQLIKQDPDATPFTIFGTKTTSRASIPATEQGKQFIDANQDWLSRFPMAGPWLMPRETPGDEYSTEAYNQQLAQHMRVRLGPADQWREMKYAKAAEPYFRMRDGFEEQRMAMTQPHMTEEDYASRKKLDALWASTRDAFLKQHPVFAEMLRTPRAAQDRQEIRDQMATARFDSAAPASARAPELGELVDRWENFQTMQTALGYSRTGQSQDQKEALRKQFYNWGQDFTRAHPQYLSLWLRVYRPEIGLDSAEIDQLDASRPALGGTLASNPNTVQQQQTRRTPWSQQSNYLSPSQSQRGN